MHDKPDSPQQLRARALRLLARREHSRAELRRKIAPHAESVEGVDAVLADLEKRKQLSDERFAEARVHHMERKYGAARIRQDLKAKGVDAESISRALTGDELERARQILQRKYRAPATTREERAKRMRFMQGRGFSWEIIRQALELSSAEPG